MKKILLASLLAVGLGAAQAEEVEFSLILDGDFASTGSPATGSGLSIYYDTDTDLLTLVAGYGTVISGGIELLGDFTASHIHNPGGSVFAPLVNTALPSEKSGVLTGSISYAGDATAEAALFANSQYVNVHSTENPGGEIAGYLTVVPEPHAAALMGLGMASLLIFRRRH